MTFHSGASYLQTLQDAFTETPAFATAKLNGFLPMTTVNAQSFF